LKPSRLSRREKNTHLASKREERKAEAFDRRRTADLEADWLERLWNGVDASCDERKSFAVNSKKRKGDLPRRMNGWKASK